MTTWRRVVGDTNDTIVVTLNGVADLSGISAIEAHVWRLDGTAPVTLSATVTDSPNRQVTVSLGSWITTAAPGIWQVEIQTTAGTVIRTWPEGDPDRIDVRAQIG